MSEGGGAGAIVTGLVEAGLLTRDAARVDIDLRKVVRGLEESKGEHTVLAALTGHVGAPCVVLSRSVLDPAAFSVVPRVVCEREGFVPLKVDDSTLEIATFDPRERPIFDQLRFVSGRSLVVYFALPGAVDEAIRRQSQSYASKASLTRGKDATAAAVHVEVLRRAPPEDTLPPDEPGFDEMAETIAFEEPLAARTALVVEDDEAIRGLLVRMLTSDGFVVEEAGNGRAGIEKLRTIRPVIALLDAMLPEVHGFEICRAIKASPMFAGVPVVIISAVYKGLDSAWEIEEVVGADAFVEKPFDLHYLRKLVGNLTGLEVHRAGVPLEHAADLAARREATEAAYRNGDAESAITNARAWATLDPFDPLPFMVMGNVHHRLGSNEAAMRAYERATVFGPEVYGAWKNLAIVAEALGFTQKAEGALKRAAALAPDDGTRTKLLMRVSGGER